MKLKCPHCGYEGNHPPQHRGKDEAFLYLEDIICHRTVIPNEDELSTSTYEPATTLLVRGYYQTGEGFDDGSNPRLLCGDCLEEFPVPEGVEVEFI